MSSLGDAPELICIDPARVGEFWPYARPFIKSAMERTGLSDFEDLEIDVLYGDQLLWMAWSGKIEAAGTTRIASLYGKKVLIITSCGGADRKRWMPLLSKIEQYASDEGCSCIRLYGRKGWERVLDGYTAEHVIMEKPINGRR